MSKTQGTSSKPNGNAIVDFGIKVGTKAYLYCRANEIFSKRYVTDTDEKKNSITLDNGNVYTYNNSSSKWTGNTGDIITISFGGDKTGNNSDYDEDYSSDYSVEEDDDK